MIRGAHIEMVGHGLIRKTDYQMYENLPHSEGVGVEWAGASTPKHLLLGAMMYIVTTMIHIENIAKFTC